MSDTTPILSLPLLQPSQAQKHVTHNEALRLLDILTQLVVADSAQTAPPAAPVAGDIHIVATGATGDWAGRDGEIAVFENMAWAFLTPKEGWQAHDRAAGATLVFTPAGWVSAGGGTAGAPETVAQLGVNATADATNRLSVSADATLLNHAGGGHQLKLNKAATGDTASLLFQSGFSGRAEMGLAGGDGFAIKVSANGATFTEALSFDGASGQPTAPQGLRVEGVLSGSAVQSGPTDDTDGRIMGVGAFGLGSDRAPARGDLDSIAQSGFYRITSGDAVAGNAPLAGQAFSVLHQQYFPGSASQIAQGVSGTPGAPMRVFARGLGGGVWTAWREVIHQGGIVAPVAQAGGVPTGGVIERGANADGEYVRFADGTQICWHEIAGVDIAIPEAGLLRSASLSWTYPLPFAPGSVIARSGSIVDSATGLSVHLAGSGSTAVDDIRAYATVSQSGRAVQVQATGRWF